MGPLENANQFAGVLKVKRTYQTLMRIHAGSSPARKTLNWGKPRRVKTRFKEMRSFALPDNFTLEKLKTFDLLVYASGVSMHHSGRADKIIEIVFVFSDLFCVCWCRILPRTTSPACFLSDWHCERSVFHLTVAPLSHWLSRLHQKKKNTSS